MAVLFLDSANSGAGSSRWSSFIDFTTGGTSPSGRVAYRAVNTTTGNRLRRNLPDVASVVVGWKQNLANLSDWDASGNAQMFRVLSDSATVVHLTVCVTLAGEVRIRRGTGNQTIIVTSDADVVSAGEWHDWEVRATIADSGGRVEVWVDGAKVIDFTGDTRNGGSKTVIDAVEFGRGSGGTRFRDLSDFVISSATVPLGSTLVADAYPTGAGANTGLSPEPDSNANWENVDEATPDGDSTYNMGDTEGQKDTYQMGDLPEGTWEVLAVQVDMYSRRGEGTRFLRPLVRTGGVDYAGNSFAQAATYTSYLHVWDVNPDTSAAWTPSQVNGLEAGVEIRDS